MKFKIRFGSNYKMKIDKQDNVLNEFLYKNKNIVWTQFENRVQDKIHGQVWNRIESQIHGQILQLVFGLRQGKLIRFADNSLNENS